MTLATQPEKVAPCFGCAGKLDKAHLATVLKRLPIVQDARLVMGCSSFEDASVFQIEPSLGLVSSVDVMDPIEPDYYRFGRVAAANALSDIYAVGGRPLVVLNIASTPASDEAMEHLYQALKGAQEIVLQAGAVGGGGHTTVSQAFKFGLAVSGRVDPGKVVTNAGARPGDRLILTKPLGAMSILSSLLPEQPDHPLVDRAFAVMEQLNRAASEVMVDVGVHACTDVTGFGFLGHLSQMMEVSGACAHIGSSQLPLLPGALEHALVESKARVNNRRSFEDHVALAGYVPPALLEAMYEASTSGGLLIAVDAHQEALLLERLEQRGVDAACVGEVGPLQAGARVVVYPWGEL